MKRAGTGANLQRRMAIARLALVVAFLGLAARAAHLSVLDERGGNLGKAQLGSVLTLPPERGSIFDRNGFELALSVDAPSIYATPKSLEDPRGAARALARALGRDAARVANRLASNSSFVFIARWVSKDQAERVQALGLRGIGIVHEPRRTYPTGPLAPQLVGFANIDGDGVRGVEQAEDAWLRGTPRRLPVERDGSGQLLVDHGNEYWSTAGGDVTLTLDATVQSEALLALNDSLARTGAKSGIVVSLDPHSGDILALAEAPSFDPNGFRKMRFADTRARTFLDALEPGSTFKAFLMAAALAGEAVHLGDLIDCEEGEYGIPGMTIRDHHPHGMLSLREILQVSSNIGAVKVAYALGPHAHVDMLRRFGFGSPTGSGFPDESAGLLRDLKRNRPVDHATLAYGQGTAVTPVQLAAATAALANGGRWIRPRVIAARRPAGGTWQPAQPSDERRVLEPEIARSVVSMLESVTQTGGTARLAALSGVPVAGKTGTAQKWDPKAGRYSDRRFVAWFIGIAPADHPRAVIVVALDEPRRPLHTGGAAAAPLFARVAAAQLARFGIMTTPEPAPRPALPEVAVARASSKPPAPVAAPSATPPRAVAAAPPPAAVQRTAEAAPAPRNPMPEMTRLSNRVLLPDLAGLTVAQVKAVTANADLLVEISGRGHAVAQSPPAGTIVASDALVVVRFEPGADSI
ncbi:MAG: transpeptidase family protein [Deltaproteobacteria bacterium]|nr:transpeptidase family protein [Deltaproteobacteria bacterium]MBW2360150.1 transpeptidase family protein [Deltaproteobacteria bacterium]